MENPVASNNQNSKMPMMVAGLGIGAMAIMIALGPLGALLAVGATLGAAAVGTAVISQNKNRGINHETSRNAVKEEQKTPEPIQLATAPKKLVDVTPAKTMSKEESKKWDDLTKETAALVKAHEQNPSEPSKPVEAKIENKEDSDKRPAREKLASAMAEIVIGKALLQMTTPPAQRVGPATHGKDVPVTNPQPNGGFKVLSTLFLSAAGRTLIDSKVPNKSLSKLMENFITKKEALVIDQEKSLGVKISESEIKEAIGNLAKYDVYYGKAGVTLGDHWPELITKAKEISGPESKREVFDGILAGLTPDVLKTIKSVKEQVKTEDHSVKTTEAPRLMSVPRDTAIDAAGMMR